MVIGLQIKVVTFEVELFPTLLILSGINVTIYLASTKESRFRINRTQSASHKDKRSVKSTFILQHTGPVIYFWSSESFQ